MARSWPKAASPGSQIIRIGGGGVYAIGGQACKRRAPHDSDEARRVKREPEKAWKREQGESVRVRRRVPHLPGLSNQTLGERREWRWAGVDAAQLTQLRGGKRQEKGHKGHRVQKRCEGKERNTPPVPLSLGFFCVSIYFTSMAALPKVLSYLPYSLTVGPVPVSATESSEVLDSLHETQPVRLR